MNKREYLNKLREYLAYELPEHYVQKNLNYYSDYIDTEVAGGKSLPAVLDDLGDPQLIARSIIDAEKSGPDGIPYTDDDPDFSQEIYGEGGGPQASSGWFGGNPGTGSGSYGQSGYEGSGGGYSSQGGYDGGNDRNDPYERRQESGGLFGGMGDGFRMYHLGCFSLVLFLLVLFCVISLLGGIVGALSPFLAPIAMAFLVMWLLNRRR